jgi:hypothetical protein
MFPQENYTPENSVRNVVFNNQSHGGLIAVVHQVSGDDESTIIFFSDQHVHHANGFHLQDKNGKGALQVITGTILGGWTYPDAIEAIADNPRKTEKTISYCFGPIGFFEQLALEFNLGYAVYMNFLETLYTEGIGETVIMKEAFQ